MSEELQGATPEGVDPLATSLALAGARRPKADEARAQFAHAATLDLTLSEKPNWRVARDPAL